MNLFKNRNFCVLLMLMSLYTAAEAAVAGEPKVIFCQFASWAVYRPGKGSFQIEHIDASLCTHIIYCNAGIDADHNEIKSLDPWQDLEENNAMRGYFRAMLLKREYPQLKVILSLGGWNEGSINYSKMCADPLRRTKFIASVVNFIKKHDFDGLTFDWRFPAQRGGSELDKRNLVPFFKELKASFAKYKFLLAVNVGPDKYIIDSGFDIRSLSPVLDYLLIMCYDYHGPWDSKLGINAPLRSADIANVEYTIKYILELGGSPKKVVMGIPLYGRTYILPGPTPDPKFGSLVKSIGFHGPYTNEDGYLGYNEICLELDNSSAGWIKHWDKVSSTPFAVSSAKVISYDDEKSIAQKVEFAIGTNLAGVVVWSLDSDDFLGDCGNKTVSYPLMKTIVAKVRALTEELLEDEESSAEFSSEEPDDSNNATRWQFLTLYTLSFGFWVTCYYMCK